MLYAVLWCVAFLLGAVLIIVAVVIRMRLKESPAFEALEEAEAHRDAPVRQSVGQAISTSRRNILVGIGLRMGENGPEAVDLAARLKNANSSIYSALLLAHAASLPAYKGQQLIGTWGAVVAALISIFTVVAFGALSDRVGRVPVYRWGALFTAVFAFPAFWLLTLGQVWLVLLVMGVGIGIGVESMLGPQCALLPELFGNAHRFTGVATAREFSAVIAGGIAPLVGAALLAATGNAWWVIAIYSSLLALISFGSTYATPETRGRSLTDLNDAGQEPVHA